MRNDEDLPQELEIKYIQSLTNKILYSRKRTEKFLALFSKYGGYVPTLAKVRAIAEDVKAILRATEETERYTPFERKQLESFVESYGDE